MVEPIYDLRNVGWLERRLRRGAVLIDYVICEALHCVGLHGAACWFANDGPGQRLLQFGLRRQIEASPTNEYVWDIPSNTVRPVYRWARVSSQGGER